MALETVAAVASLEGFCALVQDAAAIFKYCRRIVKSMANMGKDAQHLEDQVYIQHARFIIWQRLHNLVDDRTVPPLSYFHIPEVGDSVQRILAQIKGLKEDIEELAKTFKLELDKTEMSKAKEKEPAKVVRYARTNTSLQSELVSREVDRKSTEKDKIKSANSYWKRMIWAVNDFQKFQKLVKDLSTYNDQLVMFTLPMAVGVSHEALITLVPKPTRNERLELRIESI
ncbi:hypothetical protein P154DRAFT_576600 [Amniculicola lignicola CBS 123094]|uniref:Prion-inhibition and propagation HeLo domain-containing protein n=1 Tax=Amniculicola lignicola CBS 123094 TaxID=1392246 RepID=A0A6A5WGP1_9PLEO|nr:hypothetical protein P154DRAFT_576600 [Amniculicola lignicola CBS 123094]